MASNVSMIVVSNLLCVFLLLDCTFAIQINIKPRRFTGETEKDVTIRCSMGATSPASLKDVILMKVSRKGERAIALLHRNNSISYNSGNEDEFQATGSIDTANVEKSYLSLVVKTPETEDTGTYTCNVFYSNQDGQLKQDKASAYLTVDDPEIRELKETVKGLVVKLTKAESEIKVFKSKEAEFTNTINSISDRLRKVSKLIENVSANVSSNGNPSPTNPGQSTADAELQDTVKALVQKVTEMGNVTTSLIAKEAIYRDQINSSTGKLFTMTKEVQNLREKEVVFKLNISELEKSAKKHADDMNIFKKKEDNYNRQLTSLELAVNNHSETFKRFYQQELDYLYTHHVIKNTGANLERRIERMENTIKANLWKASTKPTTSGFAIPTIHVKPTTPATLPSQKATPVVAFSATNQNLYIEPKVGHVPVFPNVIMQQGTGYDPKTGVFTAPVSGIYVFHLAIKVHGENCYAIVELLANYDLLVKLKVGSNKDDDQNAISAVAKLNKGDTVKPYTEFINGEVLFTINKFSVFSGFLVHSLE